MFLCEDKQSDNVTLRKVSWFVKHLQSSRYLKPSHTYTKVKIKTCVRGQFTEANLLKEVRFCYRKCMWILLWIKWHVKVKGLLLGPGDSDNSSVRGFFLMGIPLYWSVLSCPLHLVSIRLTCRVYLFFFFLVGTRQDSTDLLAVLILLIWGTHWPTSVFEYYRQAVPL